MLYLSARLGIRKDELERAILSLPLEDLEELREFLDTRIRWIENLTDQQQLKMKRGDEELLEVNVTDLNLPRRIALALYHQNINTLKDVKNLGEYKLRLLPGVGNAAVALLTELLEDRGHRLLD